MGICGSSCFQSTSSSSPPIRTAKLILEDGRLEEFSYPVKVSSVLEKSDDDIFICNSDDMFLDGILCAVNAEDELQLGELYFALPLGWLESPLTAEDMGALTVRASLALKGRNRGDGKVCGCGLMRRMDSLVFNSRRIGIPVMDVGGNDDTVDGGGREGFLPLVKEKRKGGGGRGRSFRSKLNVILEEQIINS